jgi:hypothetical protein
MCSAMSWCKYRARISVGSVAVISTRAGSTRGAATGFVMDGGGGGFGGVATTTGRTTGGAGAGLVVAVAVVLGGSTTGRGRGGTGDSG